MVTLWENIHSHALCTHLTCSTTRQYPHFGSRVNLSLHQETNNKGGNDCNKRGKSLKRGETQLLKLFIIMYTPNPSCSGVYLSQLHALVQPFRHVPLKVYTTWLLIKLCVFGIFTCCLSRAYTAMEKANNARLYAVHVQPLAWPDWIFYPPKPPFHTTTDKLQILTDPL